MGWSWIIVLHRFKQIIIVPYEALVVNLLRVIYDSLDLMA